MQVIDDETRTILPILVITGRIIPITIAIEITMQI